MNQRQRGFSLLEMAITLAIVAFLLGGLIMTLGAQQDRNREQETRRLLIQAREALYGFAMQNGRLPCPAIGTTASGAAGAGTERTPIASGCTGGAAGLIGVLPWATLGLPESDAWGRRFSYRVTGAFAQSIPSTTANLGCAVAPTSAPAQSAFALCSRGAFRMSTPAHEGGVQLAVELPAVVLSHGPNGIGGFTSAGIAVPGAAGADETENNDGDDDLVAGSPSAAFDDHVEWIVPSILMHRMVQAGRLP